MYKPTIFTALALCASLVAAGEPDTTTTLTSTSTLTKTVTLTSCGPEVPDCPIRTTATPEPTSEPEPEPEPTTSSEEPSSSSSSIVIIPSNNATISIRPTGSKPGVIVTQTSFVDSNPTGPAIVPTEPAAAGAGSAVVQGALLFGAALFGLVALN